MTAKFFGQFLVQRGTVTAEQLLEALDEQNGLSLAKLAVAKGIVLAEDVSLVLAQLSSNGTDFGTAAVRSGILTAEQLEYLQYLLRSNARSLCDALVQRKLVSRDELTFLLDEFNQNQEQFMIRPHRLPACLTGRADAIALVSMTENYLAKYGIRPAKLSEPEAYSGRIGLHDLTARIKIDGETTGLFALSFDRSLAVVLASRMLDAANLRSDELLADALCELCNLVAGDAASKLSAAGHDLSFSAPTAAGIHEPFGLVLEAGHWEIESPWGKASLIVE